MKIYILKIKCPYYDDVEIVGVYTDEVALEKAKEIRARCSRIDDYAERFIVDKFEINKLPYDTDAVQS